jgi:DNA-binding transcriptional LysR family regulator
MICAPDNKLAARKSVTSSEIAGEPYISRESGSGTRQFADNYFRQSGVAPEDLNIVMELGSPEAIKGVVETGIGIAIMSSATVVKELKLGSLVAVPLEPRLMRKLSIVYPREKFRSRLLSTFVELATRKMREMVESIAKR